MIQWMIAATLICGTDVIVSSCNSKKDIKDESNARLHHICELYNHENISLDTAYAAGARFVLTLPLS